MGNCIFCGQDSGWFSKTHSACQDKNRIGWEKMVAMSSQAIQSGVGLDQLELSLKSVAATAFIPDQKIRGALVAGWEESVQRYLDDDLLSSDEENRLMSFAQRFSLSQSDLNTKGAFTRAAMGAVIRDVLAGKISSRVQVKDPLPFNLKRGESLIWLFKGTHLFEEKIHRSYVGGYQGVSIRVMRGVYYRIGGFKGNPVETSRVEQVDEGVFGVTDEHVYFAGARKSLRVPYNKIVSFSPYSDGIGICKDGANSRNQIFKTGEGWFVYNLVANLAKK